TAFPTLTSILADPRPPTATITTRGEIGLAGATLIAGGTIAAGGGFTATGPAVTGPVSVPGIAVPVPGGQGPHLTAVSDRLADVPVYAIGFELDTPSDPVATIEATQPASLIDWDKFTSSPLYTGVNGHGVTVAILDTGADLNHPFFGPDANGDG